MTQLVSFKEFILTSLNQAEKALNNYSPLAKSLLERTERLYNKHGYDFELECRINEVYLNRLER